MSTACCNDDSGCESCCLAAVVVVELKLLDHTSFLPSFLSFCLSLNLALWSAAVVAGCGRSPTTASRVVHPKEWSIRRPAPEPLLPTSSGASTGSPEGAGSGDGGGGGTAGRPNVRKALGKVQSVVAAAGGFGDQVPPPQPVPSNRGVHAVAWVNSLDVGPAIGAGVAALAAALRSGVLLCALLDRVVKPRPDLHGVVARPLARKQAIANLELVWGANGPLA